MSFSWSKSYPDLYKICNLYQMYEILHPKYFKYTPLPVLLQDGPQCGLVSLALLTTNASKDTVSEILKMAKERGYTCNGEMFSAEDLCALAIYFTKYNAFVYDGHLDNNYIKNFLIHGGFLLVPYDADKNHSPCLNNGHSAHWSAISGIIETNINTYVLAKHGKSKHVAIWNLKDLADSNSQLNEFAPNRKYSNVEYHLPEGGIAGPYGLRNKIILMS